MWIVTWVVNGAQKWERARNKSLADQMAARRGGKAVYVA